MPHVRATLRLFEDPSFHASRSGLTGVMRAPDDVLPVRRSYAEMLNYLRWEEALGEKYKAH